jgi:hypothetical protein
MAQATAEATMAKFHAVVYVHGMGNQQRHEELSGLAHAFYDYSRVIAPHGQHLSRAEPHNEPIQPSDPASIETEIAYLMLTQPDGEQLLEHRFYEVYWAPITAGGTTALEVLRWIFPQSQNAWRLFWAKFEDYARLRRVFLHAMFAKDRNREQKRRDEYDELLAQYGRFAYPKEDVPKSKQTFLSFLERSLESDPDLKAGVTRLAKRWILTQRLGFLGDFVILLLTTLLVFQVLFALLITLAASVVTGAGVADQILKLLNLKPLIETFSKVLAQSAALEFVKTGLEKLGPEWAPYVAGTVLIGVLYLLWMGQQVLRDFLGDVQQWTTYSETNTKNLVRQRILQRTRDVLMHTLNHPECERVTLIGHSLGSAIALDTLSKLGREVRAELDGTQPNKAETDPSTLETTASNKPLVQALQKLKAFITYGSPIDKIYYFFESRRLPLREYNGLIERQRGDLTSEPFNTELFKTGITWLNLFDQGDPVSSELYSFAPSISVTPFVHNVEVASHNLPHPASHGAYIFNTSAMHLIFNLTIHQQPPPPIPFASSRWLKFRRFWVNLFWGLLLLVGLIPVSMLWSMPNSQAIVILLWDLGLLLVLVIVAFISGKRNRYTKT